MNKKEVSEIKSLFLEVWVKIFIHSITRLIRNFRGKAISV